MVIELVAGRLVSRYLGMSLYTWTSIIGIILAGMSLGNYLGGVIADKVSPRRALAAVFLLCAGGCAALLPLNDFAGGLAALHDLAWPVRIFCHVGLVFLLPAALLGTVTPIVAKTALARSTAAGKAVGNIFAWVAAGGILGTFLTGYWLVFRLGVRDIVLTMAGALGLLGAYYLFTVRRAPAELHSASPDRHTSESKSSFRDLAPAYATVFVSNVAFMTIELAAMRIVSRHFGASLYSWTSVIGVLLAGITLGNAAGGRLADRIASRVALAVLFAFSSLLCVALPAATVLIAEEFDSWFAIKVLPWAAQTFLYTFACFFLPGLFLGTISPMVVKIALDKGRSAGRAVGAIYAWGSTGSIFGTFLAGYFLIAQVGTLAVAVLVAFVLALAAFAYAPRTIVTGVWAVVCLAAFVTTQVPSEPARDLAERLRFRAPTHSDLVLEDESNYTYIAVWRAPDRERHRLMYLDQLLHSKTDLDAPTELQYDYEWVYSAVLEKYYPAGKPINGLVIGGGGFTFPLYLELTRPGGRIEVAEIDPAVTEAAFSAFGLPRTTAMRIFNMDARNHIADRVKLVESGDESAKFDCIFGDSINDFTVPYHLTTIEFAKQVNLLLKDDGMYLLNLIDMLDSGRFLGSVVATCRSAFPFVYVFNTGRPSSVRDTFIVVSSKRPLDLAELPAAIMADHDYNGRLLTEQDLDELIASNDSAILTDDYAPVENLLLRVVASHRKNVGELKLDEAKRLADEGKFERAIDLCRDALRTKPEWPKAQELLEDLLVRSGGGAR